MRMSLEAAHFAVAERRLHSISSRRRARERETLSRNNGRHSVSGKAKKEGRGLVERGDYIILGYVEPPFKSNQHMHAQQRSSLFYNEKFLTF